MPYRRLPKTDQARIRALKAVVAKGDAILMNRVIPLQLLSEIRNFLLPFEAAHIFYLERYQEQSLAGKKHQRNVKQARLYVSHFIQVLNMAVVREEIKEIHRQLYGLSSNTHLPDLMSETSLLEWGRRIMEGERLRVEQGGIPIYNPTIARVKVYYDLFADSYTRQKQLQLITTRSLEQLSAMRERADELILEAWNLIEAYFSAVEDAANRLECCRDYGVVYYYRKGEKPAEECIQVE